MSLRAFHLLFVAFSVMLAAFFAAWALNEYQSGHQLSFALAGVLSLASGAGLAFYGAAFQRKTKNL